MMSLFSQFWQTVFLLQIQIDYTCLGIEIWPDVAQAYCRVREREKMKEIKYKETRKET